MTTLPREAATANKPAATTKATDSRLNNFDFLRFLFASIVILAHAKVNDLLSDAAAPAGPIDHDVRFLGFGRMAVNAFFILSGFLIANSWLHSRGLADYAKKRLLRIYPGLIAALLFCALVVGPLGGADMTSYFHNASIFRLFGPLLLMPNGYLPGVFTHLAHPTFIARSGEVLTRMPRMREVDGPVWTIRFEIFCYIMVAALGLLGLLRKRTVILGVFIAALAVFTLQTLHIPHAWTMQVPYFGSIDNLPRLVTFFLAGVVFYLYRNEIPHSRWWLLAAASLFVLTYKFIPSVTTPLCETYALFYVAFSQTFRVPRFAKFGDFSYGLYLYAWPAQQLLTMYFLGRYAALGDKVGTVALFVSTYAITFCLAFLSWRLVEGPFLRLKAKRVIAPAQALPQVARPETETA